LSTRDIPDLLTGLGLIHEGRLFNAAAVLLAKVDKVFPLYPQCGLRMARFRGLDKTEFIDNRQEHGNAFELLTRAQRFMRDHLPIAGRIVPNLFERIDDPLYPPAALREAVANAICHRDYSFGGGAISIAIYDGRLEISSTGILPFDLKPEDLPRPHRSRPWNPFIAQTFYRPGIIEQWGRGTLKMKEWNEEAGILASGWNQKVCVDM
jgi:ATP-dependent DNA helicase RecG